MIVTALKGLIMADDTPTPEQMVPSLLHAVMWACMFGAVDAFIAGKWIVGTIALAFSLISHIVGIKWPQIKPKISPHFASLVERIASTRSSVQILMGRMFQVMFRPVRRIVSFYPRTGESRYEYFVPVNAFSLVASHNLAVFFRDAVVYPFPFAKLRTRNERAASKICPNGRG